MAGLLPIVERMAETDPDTAKWFISKIRECQGKGHMELTLDEGLELFTAFNKISPLKFEAK
jgi:hypothetical protein